MPTDRTIPPSPEAKPETKPGSARTNPRSELGAAGELRAARFLERRGYRIVARNLRLDGVEVDLIARRGRTVAFVEVKTRRSSRFGPPEIAVDGAKQARIARAARAWLREAPNRPARVRFDVITCVVSGSGHSGNSGHSGHSGDQDHWQLVHLEAAFDDSA